MLELLIILGQGFFSTPTMSNSISNQEVIIVADHDGKGVDFFRLYIDNQPAGDRLTPSFPFTFTPGPHSVSMSAVNTGGEAKSGVLQVNSTLDTCSYIKPGTTLLIEMPKGSIISGNNPMDPNSSSDRIKQINKIKELITNRWTVWAWPNFPEKKLLIFAWC